MLFRFTLSLSHPCSACLPEPMPNMWERDEKILCSNIVSVVPWKLKEAQPKPIIRKINNLILITGQREWLMPRATRKTTDFCLLFCPPSVVVVAVEKSLRAFIQCLANFSSPYIADSQSVSQSAATVLVVHKPGTCEFPLYNYSVAVRYILCTEFSPQASLGQNGRARKSVSDRTKY